MERRGGIHWYNNINNNLALHRAAFMDYTLIVSIMIDEVKLRLDNDKKEVAKWMNEPSDQGYRAIHYASYRGNIEILSKLLENGAEVDIRNKRGLNVLHMASQGNQPSSLVYFKEKFLFDIQSPDEMGSTPLHWACYTGSETAATFLLSWKLDVNTKDKEGLTPLHLAVMSGKDIIDYRKDSNS